MQPQDTQQGDAPQSLAGRRILLGVGGGIAAYKSAELVRLLRQAGAEVQVVLTEGGSHFITRTTLQALSGRPVRDSLWDEAAEAAMGHIELARWPDLLCIAPATANLMARLAHGMASDLLSTLALASDRPLLLAPAMNRLMWAHSATGDNVALLRARGATLVGPGSGAQACGETGEGRMAEPAEIVAAVVQRLAAAASGGSAVAKHSEGAPAGDRPSGGASGVGAEDSALAGCRVVITAGPTREAIDPVRVLSNRSSGRMGFALARAARAMGAQVTLIAGPVALPTPDGVERVDVESAADMAEAASREARSADVFIGCAAVADYRPRQAQRQKIKKHAEEMRLVLERTEDVLLRVRGEQPQLFLVGFAAETEQLAEHARDKLRRKGLQMIAANDVSGGQVFDREDNALTLYTSDGSLPLGCGSKQQLAEAMMARIATAYAAHAAQQPIRLAGSTGGG